MNILSRLAFLLALIAGPSHAYYSVPRTEPVQPVAGQAFDVLIDVGRCHGFMFPFPGQPGPRIEFVGSTVRIFEPGAIDLFCNLPDATKRISVPALPEGTYTIEVYMIRLPQQEEIFLSSTVATVVGAPPQTPAVVPAYSFIGVLILLLAVTALARRHLLGLMALGLCLQFSDFGSNTVHAAEVPAFPKRILALVDADSPVTAQVIVNSTAFSAGQPGTITPGLAVENPRKANYLLLQRAEGQFLYYLRLNPELPRSMLERYIIVEYPEQADLAVALDALRNDPTFAFAYIPSPVGFHAGARVPATAESSTSAQPWRAMLALEQAYAVTGGWSTVGVIDNGVQPDHPALRVFSGTGQFLGGNFLPEFSVHVALRAPSSWPAHEYIYDFNVDEMRQVAAPPVCNDGSGFMTPEYAGHGTHVAGLIAGRDADGLGISGTCRNCALMIWRVSETGCNFTSNGPVVASLLADESRIVAALTHLSDIGAQVVNLSFGSAMQERCLHPTGSLDAYCLAISTAHHRGVLMVASAGNDRLPLNFPAEDPRVVSVGGTSDSPVFWKNRLDLPAPLRVGECPNPALFSSGAPVGSECGSNYTAPGSVAQARQEVALPALNVRSAVYTGKDWNPVLGCGDAAGGGSASDGYGTCTGTSMSAPIYSGIAGIVRSANPLLMPGQPVPTAGTAKGVRTLIAEHSSIPGTFNTWDVEYGHGVPDAFGALIAVFGSPNGRLLSNRLTPLFSFYNTTARDWAYTSTPQSALAFTLYSATTYAPTGPAIIGYPALPEVPSVFPQPAQPRAQVFVMTTPQKFSPDQPSLLPLYWMSRDASYPPGCTGGSGCNTANKDHLLLTQASEVEAARAAGYTYRGVQGYVFQRCAPEPSCMPEGSVRLHRLCKLDDNDCAVFPEQERSSMWANGYTSVFPAGSQEVMGYAYPNIDSDADGLIDGFELIIGTRPDLVDSDGDGIPDGVEFPLAGVQISDPCVGPNVRCIGPAGRIFVNGFESF